MIEAVTKFANTVIEHGRDAYGRERWSHDFTGFDGRGHRYTANSGIDFWTRIRDTLLVEEADEAKRVEAWKRLIAKDFGINVNYKSLPRQAQREPWVKAFRDLATGLPVWESR